MTLRALVAIPILLIASIIFAHPAAAETIINIDVTNVAEPATNMCTTPNDDVALTGSEHTVGALVIGADGMKLIKVHKDAHFSGTGFPSLDAYTLNETNDSEYHFSATDLVGEILSTYVLVSQSNTRNFVLVVTSRFDLATGLLTFHGTGSKCTG